MELNVKALSPKIGTEIPAPFYASAGAAAMDLHACVDQAVTCLLYTSPSPRDGLLSRMPSSA